MRVCDFDCVLVLVGVSTGDRVPELLMDCEARAGFDAVIEADCRNVCDTNVEDVWERVVSCTTWPAVVMAVDGLPVVEAICDDDAVPLADPLADAIGLTVAT